MDISTSHPQLHLIEQLYKQELLPHMKKEGLPFVKVSRQNHAFLENSILVTQNGNFFEQYHWRDKDRKKLSDVKEKGLLGKGGYKRVWDLKPLHPITTEMVRARFHWNITRTDKVQTQIKNLEMLKQEVNARFLLIPDTIKYTTFSDDTAVVQLMPKASEGNLFQTFQRITYFGRLRVLRDLALGLIDMHEKNWAHLDVKPRNIMMMHFDPDHPITKLGDFDFAEKFTCWNKPYNEGTARYMDPLCLKNMACGFSDAKVHDQFSFGATCYVILTGHRFRESIEEDALEAWVREEDFIHPSFLELNKDLQDLIKSCCLGPSKIRPYRLPEFIPILEKFIAEQVPNVS